MENRLLRHLARQDHEIAYPELDRGNGAGIAAASEPDRALVVAAARAIDAHHQRLAQVALGRAAYRLVHRLPVDELHGASSRKFTLHAHAEEVAVVAIVGGPARDLVLVGQRDLATVDLVALPAMPEAAETFAETAGVARRVAGGQPRDLGIAVGQGALDRLPHRIGNSRRLVEGHEQPASLVVQAGKGLGAAQAPRHGVDAPRPLVRGLDAGDRGGGDLEPVRAGGEPQPLGEFGPGLGLELRRGIGRHDPARVTEGGERPHDDPRHQRRLADTMPRSNGNADCVGGATERTPDMRQHLTLPGLGSRILLQHRPRLTPRSGWAVGPA